MRSRVLAAAAGLLLLAGVPASAAGPGRAQPDCREQWADLVQLHGENGNPRGPVPELTARWETLYATAGQYADTATAADCGSVVAAYASTWDHLESLQYDLHRFDPLGRLAIAEGDRRHALSFHHVKHLSAPLERAFRVARRQAPRAARDLAPALAPAATVDVDDPDAVRGVLRGLHRTARHSHHQQRLDQVLRTIGGAELSEE